LDDIALLRNYVQDHSEEAFAALVTRHINKVYSVALRHTGNAHQAEEITQAVFVILARKSGHLGRRVILSGWLDRLDSGQRGIAWRWDVVGTKTAPAGLRQIQRPHHAHDRLGQN